MKIVAISDTHGQHEKLKLPNGDLLIHAGDVSLKGDYAEVKNFLSWFERQDFKYKIFIAGNHDFYFERQTDDEIKAALPDSIIYLKDEGVEIEGVKFWGSPITPWFLNWAFNRRRGYEIARYWDLIDNKTDVLITHGPMFRRLDRNGEGQNVGCKDLFLRAQELKLKVHIFGHIHEAYGTLVNQDMRFFNASVLDEKYELVNEPFLFDL